jgi:hypothetical protein
MTGELRFADGMSTWRAGPSLLQWPIPRGYVPTALRFGPYVVPFLVVMLVAVAFLPGRRLTRSARCLVWASVAGGLVAEQVLRAITVPSLARVASEAYGAIRIEQRVTTFGVVLLLGAAVAFVAAAWAARNPGAVLPPLDEHGDPIPDPAEQDDAAGVNAGLPA